MTEAPEFALLRACARRTLDPSGEARLEALLAGPLRWDRAVALAVRHRLIPLLARHVGRRDVPEPYAAALAQRARELAAEGLELSRVLRDLAAVFEAAGIPMLAYKGPALALIAYGDVGLRHYSDLDLLVHPEDAPRALAALAARGYESVYHFSPRQDAWFRRIDGDYPLVHGTTGHLVELHARVASERFAVMLPTHLLWEDRAHATIGGRAVATLGGSSLAVALAVHGAKHRWARLEWLAALAEVLRAGGDSGITGMLERAECTGARRHALLALHLCSELLDVSLPLAARVCVESEPVVRALAKEVAAAMGGADVDGDPGEDTAANLAFNYRLVRGTRSRMRFVLGWLTQPTPEDWLRWRLADRIFPLYRLLRPLRLAAAYLPWWRRLRP